MAYDKIDKGAIFKTLQNMKADYPEDSDASESIKQ